MATVLISGISELSDMLILRADVFVIRSDQAYQLVLKKGMSVLIGKVL